MIMFLTHLFACLWFFQAKFTEFPDDCWVAGGGYLYEGAGYQYQVALHWAF